MLIHHFLEDSSTQFPAKTAVIHDGSRVAYKELNTFSNNLAAYLQENGISKGDRVALLLENSIDYVVAYYAVLKSGAVAAPLNPGLKPDGLQYLLDDLEPAAIIANFKSERLLKAVNLSDINLKLLVIRTPKQKWDSLSFVVLSFEESIKTNKDVLPSGNIVATDLACIIYTSGSTGEPKGVMLSHENIVSNTQAICQYLKLTHNDIQMVVLPFFYVMGKSLLNTHIAVGGTIVINNRFMYPADVVNQMISEKVTGFSGVPSTYAYLLNRSPLAQCKDQLPTLRYCSQAGGHMASSIKKKLRETLPDHTQIYIMYGATEASARLTYLEAKDYHRKFESIGKPIANVSISILDENGNELPDGDEGELVAAGPNIMKGYWKDPDGTARVLSAKGYHTGDVGYYDSDGYLFVKRRKDGLIKVGGHRVNPTEIEDVFMASEQLIEAVVVGVADELLGKKLIALVVPNNDDCTPKSLMEQCTKGLSKHKWPGDIYFSRSLPKNANGKIDRDKCIQMANKKNNI